MASLRALTRRQLLQLGGAGLVSSGDPRLGLILPRANSLAATEAHSLYPSGVRFVTESIGAGITLPEEFDLLAGRLIPIGANLLKAGANAIVLMSPSLSFYRGAGFHQRLTEQLTRATGLPVITASSAIIEGLKLLRARRIAVATAYTNEINLKLQGFLNEFGYEVVVLRGLSVERFEERVPLTEVLTQREAIDFIAEVRESRPEADTLLVAFGALPVLDLIAPLEKRCRIPVVAANPHALWAGMRLLGLNSRVPAFGALLDKA